MELYSSSQAHLQFCKFRHYYLFSGNQRTSGWLEFKLWCSKNSLINLNTNSQHKIGFSTLRNTDISWITGVSYIRDYPFRNSFYFHNTPEYDVLNTHLWCSDNLLANCVSTKLIMKTLYHIRKKIQLISLQLQPVSCVFFWSATLYLHCEWGHKLISVCWFLQISNSAYNFWGLGYFYIMSNTLQLEYTNIN